MIIDDVMTFERGGIQREKREAGIEREERVKSRSRKKEKEKATRHSKKESDWCIIAEV